MSKTVEKPSLTAGIKYLITIGCGVIVANLYYCQPLLGEFSRYFKVSEESASFVNICSQMGYGLGLFFIVPLGDMLARRGLLIWMHLLAALALIGTGFSPNINWLYFFSIAVGITSTACQVFIPLAMHLASEDERGKVLGILMGGLLTGILLSRSLSGFVAEYLGWQAVYFISSGFMIIMSFLIWKFIPGEQPSFKGSYWQLMRSLFSLFKEQPVIRESAWIGACLFGAISAFWATMAFFLEKPPFGYSLSVIGLFGIIGAGGALVAPFIGRVTDKYGPFKPMRSGIFLMLGGYLILLAAKNGIALMIIGIILIDMGLQSTHIPNLSRNYSLLPHARTRLNTIYMTFFFIGGTIGSSLGSVAWNKGGWTGVCFSGIILVILGAIPVFLNRIQNKKFIV
jgi:predicted MFS family arabinose efflux permease